MNQTKSDVELLWDALRFKFGDARLWHELNPMEQHGFIQGINMILGTFVNQTQGD